MIAATSAMNRAERSPSTTRWSNEPPRVVIQRGMTSPETTHGFCLMVPNATIATSPGLMMGVPMSIPRAPMLVMEMVPSAISRGWVLPSRARLVRAVSSTASSRRDSSLAFLMFGTSSPRGVAAAIPRFM